MQPVLQRRQHPEHATGLALRRGRAGLAMSQDGRNWARIEAEHHTGAVLDAGEPGAWDAAFVGAPQVRRVSGQGQKPGSAACVCFDDKTADVEWCVRPVHSSASSLCCRAHQPTRHAMP